MREKERSPAGVEKPAAIAVQVSPGAQENRITRYVNGAWYVKIAARAIEGKANEELVRFLSDVLDVRKDDVMISQGKTGRRKLVKIAGLTAAEVTRRLDEAINKG